MVDGVSGDGLMLRVLQEGVDDGDGSRVWVVVGGSGRRASPLLAEGLVLVVGGLVPRSWWCWSPLVSGQLLAWRKVSLGMLMVKVVVLLVSLMVRVLPVMLWVMPVAWVL